jgi:hypothetical protein
MLAVLATPRRAGRSLVQRGLAAAAVTHATALLLSAGVSHAGYALLRSEGDHRTLETFLSMAGPFFSGYRGLSLTAGLLVSALLFELYFWAFGVGVLGSWAAPAPQAGRRYQRAAILTGFASMHLATLTTIWCAAALLMASDVLETSVAASTLKSLLGGASMTGGVVLATALAMRMARGYGEALGPPAPREYPVCEFCGYNLHATDSDRPCPECGEPAARSLSSIHRVDAWEVGRRGYLATLWRAVLTPAMLFRRVSVRRHADRARRFFVISTAFSAAILATMTALAYLVSILVRPDSWPLRLQGGQWRRMAALAGAAGGLWSLLLIIGTMIAVNMLTTGSRKREDYLGPVGALKLGCYLSALSVPWAILTGLALCATFGWRSLPGYTPSYNSTLTLSWSIYGVGLLVWYWIAGARAYEACQFANR